MPFVSSRSNKCAAGGLVAAGLVAAVILRTIAGSAAPTASIAPARETARAAAPSPRDEPEPPQPTGDPVPQDIRADVVAEQDGARVSVRRPGYLVSLRLGDARAAGKGEASLLVSAPGSEVGGAVLSWEATHLATLATARGTLQVEGAEGRLTMTAPPRIVQTLEGRRHRCVGLDDARGGFTALCIVRAAGVRAASLTTEGPLDHAWVVDGARGEKVARVDLPLDDSDSGAGAIGYFDAGIGIVVRLEASRLPGEPRGALLLAANEKRQPAPPPGGFSW